MAKEPVRVFTAPGCAPCDDIKKAVEEGTLNFSGVALDAPIEFVDLSTDEGYPYVDELGLANVPAAYYESRQCKLLVDDETGQLTIDCRVEATEDSQEAPDPESPVPSPS